MESSFIPSAIQNLWNLWNVRGFMILSLCMQLILAFTAPLRQKTSDGIVTFVVWSSYLLSDWAALFVFGLISNAGCRHLLKQGLPSPPPDMEAFWAAFLLVHLGGPDSITAFSLEDNALWLRYLGGLVAQLSVFLYIFMKTLPNNRLLVPTVLMFVAGVINYGERTRALYLASLENLKTKSVKENTIPNLSKVGETFHQIANGLVRDIMPDLQECNKCRDLIFEYGPAVPFVRIEKELNLLYELLYTKAKAATSTWGILARGISYYSTQVAFILFCLADKHGFHGVDLTITYTLFVGVFILHVANTVMLGTTALRDFGTKEVVLLALELGIFPLLVTFALYILLPTSVQIYLFNKTWSEKMGSVNMLAQSFKHCMPRRGRKLVFIWNKLVGGRRTSREDVDLLLWDSVYEDIQRKAAGPFVAARMRELYDTRGDRALEEINCHELLTYIRDFEYENTLLIWHVATEICLNIEGEEDDADLSDWKTKRILSKKLSDYLMYLLVGQPKLMSAVAGISQIRYKDTCVELKFLGRRSGSPTLREFCASIVQEYANITESPIEGHNHVHSVLKDSCGLVKLLLQRGKDNRWDAVHKVWLEMLSYAAGHCRVELHLRLLSEGCEFLTFVWMLMAFCGIRDQFPAK